MRWTRDGGVFLRRLTIAFGVLLVGGSVYIALVPRNTVVVGPTTCTVAVGAGETQLSAAQAENAATIVAISVQRGLPIRAAAIALAAALQESKLINVQHGDRDSLGLFQQRPSQGWGTAEQILDPVYATNAFYDALVKVRGYRKMSITDAAQAVQRSAFPNAYSSHEEPAQALADALAGRSPRSLTCTVPGTPSPGDVSTVLSGIQEDLTTGFGQLVTVTRNGDSLIVQTVGDRPRRLSWSVASYLVARARILNVGTVAVGSHIWDRDRGTWKPGQDQSSGTVAVTSAAAHR
jgi:hypothetical protein